MKLAEAILEVESWFKVCSDVGYREAYTDQNGKAFGSQETVNFSLAPCGEPYVTVVSGGVKEQGAPMPMFFRDEDLAISFWRYAVEDYAETIAPREQWSSLHLYWREQPAFAKETYVALDQAGMLRNRSKFADVLTLEIGAVWSRLLISRLDPDGKE